jgi:hypothetical protein
MVSYSITKKETELIAAKRKKKTWQKVAYGRFLSVFLFEWLKPLEPDQL